MLKQKSRIKISNFMSFSISKATVRTIEFFTVCTKLAEMTLLTSRDLIAAKIVISSRARPDARNYYWYKSPMPNQLS